MELSRAAERLIVRHVDSAGALDLLLLLHATRDRQWRFDELCRELRCPDAWARAQLERLAQIELVTTAEDRHRFRRGREYGAAVDEVARAYRRDRAAVTRLVFTRPARRQSQPAG